MELFEVTTQQERRRVTPLFDGIEDSLIRSFLQGHAGYGWCDDLAFPRCAVILNRDILFIGGDSASENAKEMAAMVPAGIRDEYYVIPCDDSWLPLIEAAHEGHAKRETRYAMARDKSGFDKDKLRQWTRALPQGYVLLGMDEELYDMAKAQEWSRDLTTVFDTAEEFVDNAIGFCVLKDDELVAGAASMGIHDEGIEVEIVTREDSRRQGFALACGAALILSCLAQNKFPCWDAANKGSLALAEKLGYKLAKEYEYIHVTP